MQPAHLLEEKLFEEISIAEIVEQAGCSVGAFYGRFKDKNSLLMALDERHFEEFDVDTSSYCSIANEKTTCRP